MRPQGRSVPYRARHVAVNARPSGESIEKVGEPRPATVTVGADQHERLRSNRDDFSVEVVEPQPRELEQALVDEVPRHRRRPEEAWVTALAGVRRRDPRGLPRRHIQSVERRQRALALLAARREVRRLGRPNAHDPRVDRGHANATADTQRTR